MINENNTLHTSKRYTSLRIKTNTYNRLKEFWTSLSNKEEYNSFDDVINAILTYMEGSVKDD